MNMNMEFERQLTIPMEVKKMYPLEDELRAIVERRFISYRFFFDPVNDKLFATAERVFPDTIHTCRKIYPFELDAAFKCAVCDINYTFGDNDLFKTFAVFA